MSQWQTKTPTQIIKEAEKACNFFPRKILITQKEVDSMEPLEKRYTKWFIKAYPEKIGDNTTDEILKHPWYDELSQQDKDRLVCVFDARQKVVDMWRSLGITCLQVAPGDF